MAAAPAAAPFKKPRRSTRGFLEFDILEAPLCASRFPAPSSIIESIHLGRARRIWERLFSGQHGSKEFAGLVGAGIIEGAGLVDAHPALGEGVDFVARKNEAILGGVVRNALVFMDFRDGGGVLEVAFAAREAVGLDLAELLERSLELAREAGAMEAEDGDGAVGIHDIEGDGGFSLAG